MAKMNLNEWIEAYQRGEFTITNADRYTIRHGIFRKVCAAGWYDWFCSDMSCATALKTLAPKVIALSKSPFINPEKTYVGFENKCPVVGPTYNMFALYDIDTDEQLWGFSNLKKGCYGREFSGWTFSGVVCGKWCELGRGNWNVVKNYFKIK